MYALCWTQEMFMQSYLLYHFSGAADVGLFWSASKLN